MATPVERVQTALVRWRNNLIDLTRRNPLLSLKTHPSSYLEITQPDLSKVFDQIHVEGKAWLFLLPEKSSKTSSSDGVVPDTNIQSAPPNGRGAEKADKKAATPKPNELVTSQPDRAILLQTLTNLYRRAATDYRERGLHILHLALGVLEWRDEAEEVFRSPILLLPVKLQRHSLRDPFSLQSVEEDPIVNPALAARLKQDFDFRLPDAPADWEEKKPEQYLADVKAAITGLPGWDVHANVVLTPFSFFKGVIFQDLHDNAGHVTEHPVLHALTGSATASAKETPLRENELDQRQDPRSVYHILDADGSQRLCLEAAAHGESFVLIGPPGTGKSQTIANLIADRIGHGKKVLFVSEKMAALEVVYKRLTAVGLGEFCLELHSHKANKREVIKELARCYAEKVAPQTQPHETDYARLVDRRDRLQRYVVALHQVREPMKRSVWDALAELPRWQDLAMLPLGLVPVRTGADAGTKLTLAEFAPAHLDELTQLLQRLQRHWHIRSEANYPWRGFKADRYSLQLRDDVVSLIDKVRARGDKLVATADQYADELGVQGAVGELVKLADLLEKRPANTLPAWLTMPDLATFVAEFEKCADQYNRLGQTRKPLTDRYGQSLWMLPPGTAAKVEQAWKNAAKLLAPGDERGAEFLKLQQKMRAWTAETQKRIPAWLVEIRTLEKWLPVALPIGGGSTAAATAEGKLDPSIASVRAYLRLASLGVGDAPPDKLWLEDRNALKEAQDLIASLKPSFVRYKQNRQYLLKIYEPKLFDLDLVRIGQAYAGPYQSWLCLLSWQYYTDRRAVAKCRPNEDLPATVAYDMQLAGQAKLDQIKIETDPAKRTRLVGRYDKGLDTDIESAERGARHAAEALDLTGELDCEKLSPKCIEALTAGTTNEKIRAAIKRVNESFVAWTHLTEELKSILPMSQLPALPYPLEECSLTALTQYAKDLQTALNQFAGLADPVLATAPPADAQTLAGDLKQAEELLTWEASQATEAERWSQQLGPAFQGVSTQWDALRRSIHWARSIRECIGAMQFSPLPAGGEGPGVRGPLVSPLPAGGDGPGVRGLPPAGDPLLKAASGSPPSSREMRIALEQYEHALHSFEVRYDAPGPQLDGKALKLHSPKDILALLAKWRDRVGELADWVDWRYLPERFHHLGLGQFWDHLQQQEVALDKVVDLFMKSFWSAWIDAIFQHDPTLSQYRRGDHEQMLQEFRELDRKILQQNAARIAGILDPQQSQAPQDSEIALLMKEAHKKTKHLALRQLFDAMPALLMRLKPCMLMSPLSVSQFLPAGKLTFDLVVFDEASQILPEDAVGAIYRGKQVVITGDNHQLPPTMFFQQNADDGGEDEPEPLFESVLDACLGAGFPRKTLRWHYRSQHEHLIAFSNESFYDGRLVTFPSASDQSETLGVQFQLVKDGVYDRGNKRDNLREAQAVAQRVLEHFRQCPEKTLGVIAFSYAQMNAIEDELDRQLREHPDLEKYFKDDRLEGFFVKNLETVQGDERDVILLSVGYGRDAQGKIELNFGPLNREGGERRLNVAVTRARQRLVIVSSIRASDIKLGNSQAKGLAHLQRFLDFAERGISAIEPDADTPPTGVTGLHDDVLRELKNLGYDAAAYVGCGIVRLDIGVRDPKQAGRFILGIEFDGPMYAQAATVRDRERLRGEVLARLGWKLHRIAAADWLYRKQEEIARLKHALG
jgi:hypothetical protein